MVADVLSSYSGPGALLGTLHVLSLMLTTTCEVILQMRKLKFMEIK